MAAPVYHFRSTPLQAVITYFMCFMYTVILLRTLRPIIFNPSVSPNGAKDRSYHQSYGIQLANLVNRSFNEARFPENTKVAQNVPVYKKSSNLDKSNCRTVSLLPVMSKIYERDIYEQLLQHSTPFFMLLDQVMAVIILFSKLLKIGSVS